MDEILFKAWSPEIKGKVIYVPYAKRKNKYRAFVFIETSEWSVEKDSIENQFIGDHSSSMYHVDVGLKKVFDIIFNFL